MKYKFLIIFGSFSEPYTLFGPYDSYTAAYDAARATHAVQAGYPGYHIMPIAAPDVLTGGKGGIPKVDQTALEAQNKADWDEWGKKLSGCVQGCATGVTGSIGQRVAP